MTTFAVEVNGFAVQVITFAVQVNGFAAQVNTFAVQVITFAVQVSTFAVQVNSFAVQMIICIMNIINHDELTHVWIKAFGILVIVIHHLALYVYSPKKRKTSTPHQK